MNRLDGTRRKEPHHGASRSLETGKDRAAEAERDTQTAFAPADNAKSDRADLTAIQLHLQLPRGEIAFGSPDRVCPGARGPVALFVPGTLVAYELRFARRRRLYVFRTLRVDDPLGAVLPGVHRRVRLLLSVRTPARIARARALLATLAGIGWPPNHLSDTFFARLAAVLEGRLPPPGLLAPLLRREHDPPPAAGIP